MRASLEISRVTEQYLMLLYNDNRAVRGKSIFQEELT